MNHLDSKLMKKVLIEAGKKLKGNWLLMGGTLLPAVGLDIRSTVDIDLVSLDKELGDQTLSLMEIAESLGLSVETINSAAAFFFKKIGARKEDLILLHQGKSAIIYRPSLALYWKLKVGRLTESDLLDCQHYFHYCCGKNEAIPQAHLQKVIDHELSLRPSSDRASRLNKLASMID